MAADDCHFSSDIYELSLGPNVEAPNLLTVQHDIEIFKLFIAILAYIVPGPQVEREEGSVSLNFLIDIRNTI